MNLDLGRRSIVEWAESAPEAGSAAEFSPAQDSDEELQTLANYALQ